MHTDPMLVALIYRHKCKPAQKLDAVQIILVYKNIEKAAVGFGACMCTILGGSHKLNHSDCEN